ncbi:isoprenyl transferase [Clostridiaceae bacterium M8S5]|nr:isoprenyl transferase [Clostridiaceae bacterium M8S5]
MNKKELEKLKNEVLKRELPKHIAITMDGNGRWAKKRFLPRTAGHREGVKTLRKIVEVCGDIGIKHLTVFAFSTENWKRPDGEVSYLLKLLREFLKKDLNTLHKNNVKINIWGNISEFDSGTREEIKKAIKKTEGNTKLQLNLALNYGGRSDIVKACKNISMKVKLGELDIEQINEDMFNSYLYSENQPEPELLIRTGGDYRLSNFLLYQSAYTELWFTDVYWPAFNEEIFYRAILDYYKVDRRFGDIQ